MDNSIADKIDALISRLEQKRANYYPADWDADPLYEVIGELRKIVAESGGKRAAPSLRQVGISGK